jgi:hypothetical protein
MKMMMLSSRNLTSVRKRLRDSRSWPAATFTMRSPLFARPRQQSPQP